MIGKLADYNNLKEQQQALVEREEHLEAIEQALHDKAA